MLRLARRHLRREDGDLGTNHCGNPRQAEVAAAPLQGHQSAGEINGICGGAKLGPTQQ